MALSTFVTVEGGLLPSQLLDRVVAADPRLDGTAPDSYHVESTTELNQAISRAWASLAARWAAFRTTLAALPEQDRATTLTRERWLLPLFQELGFGRLLGVPAGGLAGRAISHAWSHVPVHLVGARLKLDTRVPGERGAASASPHGLVQDLLNQEESHLWAFVSNGLELRLLRDHRSLTRQAYIAFDLESIFDGEQFSAFRLLWLLCHQSRVEAAKPTDCWLEKWFAHARDEGIAAQEKMREGVETALCALGSGFLKHPANERLLVELAASTLSTQDYYRQLLRLVYRLIFLFVAEDRGVLLIPGDDARAARERYIRLYASARLRRLAMRRRGGPHSDGWQALLVVMRGLDRGCQDLALPGLGSFLWGSEPNPSRPGERRSRALPNLESCSLANEALYEALHALCVVQDGPVRRRVDWATVQVDELGSVYEALMERVPRMNAPAGFFELAAAAGNERKTTGSYYTPSTLVDCLLDSALEPVLDDACKKAEPEKAILELAVVDPACGSGHFLVAAARRIALRLARVRAGGIEPSPPEVQHALRDVVGRCIHGVDLNPMAVELCKVSLWMEAVEPGRPLSFLDAHIQHGNALLGTTPELMAKGIPDAAWEPIEGDDKKTASALKKRNKKHSVDEQLAWSFVTGGADNEPAVVAKAIAELETASDADPGALEKKEAQWEGILESNAYRHQRFVADAWCAAFVWPKQPGPLADAAPTNELWRQIRDRQGTPSALTLETAEELATGYRFLHWHLAFPRVFEKGGFDVVLGNPPWERVKLQEQEFFASRSDEIATAPNAAARKKLITALPKTDPALWSDWCTASRAAEGQSHFVRQSGRYPLCGKGDVNTYALFAEHNRSVLGPRRGRAGFIVPTGIATDDTTKVYFKSLLETGSLCSLYDFQTGPETFGNLAHGALRFCLIVISAERSDAPSDLSFFAKSSTDLRDPSRHISLSAADFTLLNPNTQTCPTFPTRRDADLNRAMYGRAGVLWREDLPDGNTWGVRFMAMFHMANDS
ncbi:MAG: N-6 DNA methylase, partial [Polyangiaceae bacterium]|nr:N-6 DNA methylase [Polyangiaceae bacterium]